MIKKYLLAAIVAVFSLTACAPYYNVNTDYSETANFASYKTYLFRTDDLKLNDIDKDRVLNEVAKNLQMKGLSSSQNPDLIINLKASHKNIHEVNRGYYPYAYGRWPYYGSNRGYSNNYTSGALVVDMIDNKTKKLVWQGKGSGISVDNTKAKQRQIPEIVSEIMQEFPPKK